MLMGKFSYYIHIVSKARGRLTQVMIADRSLLYYGHTFNVGQLNKKIKSYIDKLSSISMGLYNIIAVEFISSQQVQYE